MAQIYSFAKEEHDNLPIVNTYSYGDYVIMDTLGENHVLSITVPNGLSMPSKEAINEILEYFDMTQYSLKFHGTHDDGEKVIYYLKL